MTAGVLKGARAVLLITSLVYPIAVVAIIVLTVRGFAERVADLSCGGGRSGDLRPFLGDVPVCGLGLSGLLA